VQSPITALTRGQLGDCELWPTKSNNVSTFKREATLNTGACFMISDDDAHTILRNIRLIALHCFDLSAVGRLRLLADQIEEKIQTPSVIQTKPCQDGVAPAWDSTMKYG
jgi:hypothetical protein